MLKSLNDFLDALAELLGGKTPVRVPVPVRVTKPSPNRR